MLLKRFLVPLSFVVASSAAFATGENGNETVENCLSNVSELNLSAYLKCYDESYEQAGLPAGWDDYTGKDFNDCKSQCDKQKNTERSSCRSEKPGNDRSSCNHEANKSARECRSSCERVAHSDNARDVAKQAFDKKK
jgi:hypothetical protein